MMNSPMVGLDMEIYYEKMDNQQKPWTLLRLH